MGKINRNLIYMIVNSLLLLKNKSTINYAQKVICVLIGTCVRIPVNWHKTKVSSDKTEKVLMHNSHDAQGVIRISLITCVMNLTQASMCSH